jgi:hypothetical protein
MGSKDTYLVMPDPIHIHLFFYDFVKADVFVGLAVGVDDGESTGAEAVCRYQEEKRGQPGGRSFHLDFSQ